MISAVHFSSATDEWETPTDFFRRLHIRWGFSIDVCATPRNAKCVRYITPEMDGLTKSWVGEFCWMNPPYGREIARWVAKAALETRTPDTVVVALLPARTDTKWWRDWVVPWARIRFLTGRLKFGGAKSGAPFPSALAIYPKNARPPSQQLEFPDTRRGQP